jgi:hypothetical protein
LIIIFWLVEKKIGGEFLILITGEIGLNSLIAVETKSAQLKLSLAVTWLS